MQHPGNSLLMITQSGEVFGVELRAWKLNANCKRSTTFQLLPIVWHIKQGAQLWCYRIKKKESAGWNKCIMQNVSPLFIPVIPHKCESHILTSFWMRNFLLDSLLNLYVAISYLEPLALDSSRKKNLYIYFPVSFNLTRIHSLCYF